MKPHTELIQSHWIDSYGHLNEAYYVVAFSNATWPLQNNFKIGLEYYKETGCALFTVETHIRYLKEVRAPAILSINSLILDVKDKKLWIAHQMEAEEIKRATFECILIHYDTINCCSRPFPKNIYNDLTRAKTPSLPKWVNSSITL